MTIVAFPLDAVSGAPSYTGEMLRQALSTLAGYAPPGRPLGVTSGVRGGTPATTVTATGTTWTIAPHSGALDLETSATAGPYFYAVKTSETGSVTAANATNDRIDIVYVQINDPAESDGSSTPGVVSGYLAGTASSSPVAPSAPNSRCLILAQIYVPKSGTGSPSVTWVAPTTTASGPAAAYSYGSTLSLQNFASGAYGVVNTWTLTTKNIGYSSGTWTIATPGLYRIDARLAFVPVASPTGIRTCEINVNGTQVVQFECRGDVGYALPMPVSLTQPLAAGDTIAIQGFQSQGSSLTLSGIAKQNVVSIARVGDA